MWRATAWSLQPRLPISQLNHSVKSFKCTAEHLKIKSLRSMCLKHHFKVCHLVFTVTFLQAVESPSEDLSGRCEQQPGGSLRKCNTCGEVSLSLCKMSQHNEMDHVALLHHFMSASAQHRIKAIPQPPPHQSVFITPA